MQICCIRSFMICRSEEKNIRGKKKEKLNFKEVTALNNSDLLGLFAALRTNPPWVRK
jgi:hypothetical protein